MAGKAAGVSEWSMIFLPLILLPLVLWLATGVPVLQTVNAFFLYAVLWVWWARYLHRRVLREL